MPIVNGWVLSSASRPSIRLWHVVTIHECIEAVHAANDQLGTSRSSVNGRSRPPERVDSIVSVGRAGPDPGDQRVKIDSCAPRPVRCPVTKHGVEVTGDGGHEGRGVGGALAEREDAGLGHLDAETAVTIDDSSIHVRLFAPVEADIRFEWARHFGGLGIGAYEAFGHKIDNLSATVLSCNASGWTAERINHKP